MASTADGGLQVAVIPIRPPDLLLMVARERGPQFHRVELAGLARLVEVTRTVAMAVTVGEPDRPSALG